MFWSDFEFVCTKIFFGIQYPEGQTCKTLSCATGTKYYVSHDGIETIDINELDIDKYSKHSEFSNDSFDVSMAIISTDGSPKIKKGNSVKKETKSILGGVGILSKIISSDLWVLIFGIPIGNEIFINDK